ncbi:hypothetical protein AMTR_s00096p00118830 [Amborella trichopoda]|uniref:Uncharacterized protein n=1 Tax=Amborella trichopoda TaxID=13333 RepID=W1P618_AMBTC|nr:hypothetical protein AMTR_s00096p00118830 [Amborella trichopoda]
MQLDPLGTIVWDIERLRAQVTFLHAERDHATVDFEDKEDMVRILEAAYIGKGGQEVEDLMGRAAIALLQRVLGLTRLVATRKPLLRILPQVGSSLPRLQTFL